jgi:hypothetical protein
MQHFHIIIKTLFVIIFCTTLSTHALASTTEYPEYGDENLTTLTWNQCIELAKLYTPYFQAVDPDITTKDLKVFIRNLDTSDKNTIETALQDYLESLQPEDPNEAPMISGTPGTSVTEGENYLFQPSASDPDGDSLNFSIANKPVWASFDASTGTLSGNPADGSAGLYSDITISVSDGELSDSLASFAIQVEEAPQTLVAGPPVLASANVVDTNIMLSWTMENAIPEGGYDIFIDGVDTGNQYRTSNTSVSLSGLDLSQSHCFMVESRYTDTSEFYSSNQLCSEAQGSANQAPVISGTPSSTATVGANYSFTPTASDADGDSLSFSVSNLPAWASFDNQTGTLSGDPQSMDVGSYDNILISVSDGTDSSQLAAFSILVEEQAALASASLDWAAPSTREDGTALSLSEIDGYRIYMGDSASSLVAVMDINDYSITEYTLTGIQQGDHYFAVTAYDKAGSESGLSNIILKTCN